MGRATRSSELVQEDSNPSWDTTPIFMRAWLDALPEYLEKIDPNFVSWWSQGYVLDRNSTVCGPNLRHTVALRDDSVRVHTFAKPSQRTSHSKAGLLASKPLVMTTSPRSLRTRWPRATLRRRSC